MQQELGELRSHGTAAVTWCEILYPHMTFGEKQVMQQTDISPLVFAESLLYTLKRGWCWEGKQGGKITIMMEITAWER